MSKYREELLSRLPRAEAIVSGLKDYEPFEMVVEDVKKQIDGIDKYWHLIPDSSEWASKVKELKILKLSSEYIVNLITTYEKEVEFVKNELFKLDNPEIVIDKDYDNE